MNDTPQQWFGLARTIMQATPFFAALGAEFVAFADGLARAKLAYGPHLVGDPDTGVVHGGVMTTVLDHVGGAAVLTALEVPMAIATLDLRIDYMKPAEPGADILAEARCIRVAHDIAFVRGSAYQADPGDPIALCTGAFMLSRMATMLLPAEG